MKPLTVVWILLFSLGFCSQSCVYFHFKKQTLTQYLAASKPINVGALPRGGQWDPFAVKFTNLILSIQWLVLYTCLRHSYDTCAKWNATISVQCVMSKGRTMPPEMLQQKASLSLTLRISRVPSILSGLVKLLNT